MNHEEFVNVIAMYVAKFAPKYGISVHSPIIAQAILESGWGTTNKATHNNFFGLKYRQGRLSCHSGFFTDSSSEEYTPGVYTPIVDQWYEFDTIEDGVEGYFQFINIPNYANLKGVSDPKTYVEKIMEDGYATSSTYVEKIMKLIDSQDLTRFDPVKESEKTEKGYTLKINQNPNFGTHNTSNRLMDISFIVIHYVGATGDAKANVNYYNDRSTTRASADFFVGFAGDIWQYNPDPLKRYCWAVGGGRQSSYGGKYYGIATNANCVSIEMCVRNKGNMKDNSPDWYFEKATIDSAVELTKYLMKLYNVDINHVIRHFDVNGKSCPGVVGWNSITDDESAWKAFLSRVETSKVTDDNSIDKDTEKAQEALDGLYRVRKSWDEEKSQIGAYKYFANAKKYCPVGYKVFDSTGHVVWEPEQVKSEFESYRWRVVVPDLNIRTGPGTNYAANGVTGIGTFTIVDESDGKGAVKWGRLKSGKGWISLGSKYGYRI